MRLCWWRDAAAPLVVRRWVRELDYNRALPLLALEDGDVVAAEALLGKRYEWWPFRVSISQAQVRFPW